MGLLKLRLKSKLTGKRKEQALPVASRWSGSDL